ncbi:MAG: hypothetical protein WBQ72_21695 [Terriglobales bacterium]
MSLGTGPHTGSLAKLLSSASLISLVKAAYLPGCDCNASVSPARSCASSPALTTGKLPCKRPAILTAAFSSLSSQVSMSWMEWPLNAASGVVAIIAPTWRAASCIWSSG